MNRYFIELSEHRLISDHDLPSNEPIGNELELIKIGLQKALDLSNDISIVIHCSSQIDRSHCNIVLALNHFDLEGQKFRLNQDYSIGRTQIRFNSELQLSRPKIRLKQTIFIPLGSDKLIKKVELHRGIQNIIVSSNLGSFVKEWVNSNKPTLI
jgi:hypothetical protein